MDHAHDLRMGQMSRLGLGLVDQSHAKIAIGQLPMASTRTPENEGG